MFFQISTSVADKDVDAFRRASASQLPKIRVLSARQLRGTANRQRFDVSSSVPGFRRGYLTRRILHADHSKAMDGQLEAHGEH